jgi:predicted regulator of Ras-like GTPase activity (Roadblock/LC7/MglB family)
MVPEAVRRWSDELASDPASLAFIPLATELRRRGELDTAMRVVLRGLERHPYLADAHDLLARLSADLGDDQRAREEWETALRLEPRHPSALKGLGFLSCRRGDYAAADRLLRAAVQNDPHDRGLQAAHERVVALLAGHGAAAAAHGVGPATSNGNGHGQVPAVMAHAPAQARALFAPLLGAEDRTALLIDRDGLVIAGSYVDESGREVGDEIGAELSGIVEESSRALSHLGLGVWESILVEAQHATVALAPVDDTVVMVAAARDTHVGFVRRLLSRARQHATGWLERVS